jgi:hypothetical protein
MAISKVFNYFVALLTTGVLVATLIPLPQYGDSVQIAELSYFTAYSGFCTGGHEGLLILGLCFSYLCRRSFIRVAIFVVSGLDLPETLNKLTVFLDNQKLGYQTFISCQHRYGALCLATLSFATFLLNEYLSGNLPNPTPVYTGFIVDFLTHLIKLVAIMKCFPQVRINSYAYWNIVCAIVALSFLSYRLIVKTPASSKLFSDVMVWLGTILLHVVIATFDGISNPRVYFREMFSLPQVYARDMTLPSMVFMINLIILSVAHARICYLFLGLDYAFWLNLSTFPGPLKKLIAMFLVLTKINYITEETAMNFDEAEANQVVELDKVVVISVNDNDVKLCITLNEENNNLLTDPDSS